MTPMNKLLGTAAVGALILFGWHLLADADDAKPSTTPQGRSVTLTRDRA